jgi:hypothetical protein
MTPHQQASPQGNESNWSAWKRTIVVKCPTCGQKRTELAKEDN